MPKNIIVFLFSLLLLLPSVTHADAPKREMRAVWIATIGNIDWPSKRGLSAQQQQQEFIQQLDFFKGLGFNSVIVQIRPAADAFYDSPYEPWSIYLSGRQGQPPFPKYDPLTFMINETHKRNMDFHAWFNPFRALVNSRNNPNPPDHVTRQHPDWIINYGGKSYFDPGNPDARNYIIKVILDVVKRYDIDAVHIDDYFYPYRIAGQTFRDAQSFAKYNSQGLNLEDWRRNNVNTFISTLNYGIKREKSWVQFGVSPFGIWRNKKQDPDGSETNGTSAYDELYSDVVLWMQKNWVDYVAPQLYWTRNSRAASFSALLPWWLQHKGRNRLYIGLGLYQVAAAKPGTTWYNHDEILSQIRMGREQQSDGFVFYSAVSFKKIPSTLLDSIRNNYFSDIALPPAMPWLSKKDPGSPTLTSKLLPNGHLLLQWTPRGEQDPNQKYVVYRFDGSAPFNIQKAGNMLTLTKDQQFEDITYRPGQNYRYVVTTLDRTWNESAPSNMIVQ